MDYYKIKAEAEAIRDEAGLPAAYYPVFVCITDELIAGTGYTYEPAQYGPHLRLALGREYIPAQPQEIREAFASFRVRVFSEAARAKVEARRHDVRARWAARRAARQ